MAIGYLGGKQFPQVSVIVVNLNGKEHLGECFASLHELNYPKDKLDVILVDNASTDGSADYVKENFPWVKIIQNKENVGFAAAINIGARKARGDYLAFLNNDTRVDPDWLVELLIPVLNNPDVACAGSKILTWDGKAIDFAESALSFYGHGFKLDTGSTDIEAYDEEKPILFACGGAMLVDKQVYFDTGGFDDDYFAFFEDVDFGWRLWALGYRVVLAPKSIVYHRFHGTTHRFGYEKERMLLERNAIYTIFKNYGDENLQCILPPAILLSLKRGLVEANLDKDSYRFGREERGGGEQTISRIALSHFLALDDVIEDMPKLIKKRSFVQTRRRRRDVAIFSLFKEPFRPNIFQPQYVEAQRKLSNAFEVERLFERKTRVLIISNDTVARRMAGPAIRCWEFAKALSREHEVILAIPNETDLKPDGFKIETYEKTKKRKLEKLAKWCDLFICQGFILHHFPFLKKARKPIVVDVYDPFTLEMLELFKYKSFKERLNIHEANLTVLNDQLLVGDFFICASEKQRDFWIGMLSSLNRINPSTYDSDKTLRSFIDVVPFGLPSLAPRHTRQVLKGAYRGLDENDKVILWGGGIYNWFDPITLIKAMYNIAQKRGDVKLFFMGLEHPNPDVPEMKMCVDAIRLSKELDLYDEYVFFNFGWIPYDERQNYLLEADIGISIHLQHVETEFSYRTRLLDYIWAGLPIVATKGDSMSELVERHNLGRTVEPENVENLTEVLLELLENPELCETFRENLRKIAPQFTWEKVTEPLNRFCYDPKFAPDKILEWEEEKSRVVVKPRSVTTKPKIRKSPLYYLGRVVYYYRRGGFQGVIFHGKDFLRRLKESLS
ncbi:MAG: glycosyltransferase [Actinomycetota bacterium]|nr:glycosyltransferase [Actinomycetota bacterium]